jgi:hypothetical protein
VVQLKQHNTADDAWICVRGKVYNITPYLKFHPGGVDQILRGAGKDATKLFGECCFGNFRLCPLSQSFFLTHLHRLHSFVGERRWNVGQMLHWLFGLGPVAKTKNRFSKKEYTFFFFSNNWSFEFESDEGK